MAATKEMLIDMKEKEYTINTTFKLIGKELEFWEYHFRQNLNVIDFKIVSDTNQLYATDEKFKRLVKAKKAATVACELYINKHNG